MRTSHMATWPEIPDCFNVGPWQYRVEIVDNLREDDGTEALGLCDNGEHIIYLDSALPGRVVMSVLIHELRHAWAGHVPRPRTYEEDCDLTATICAAFIQDLGLGAVIESKPAREGAAA